MPFSSMLSREVFLEVAAEGGELELRELYKRIQATSTAVRLHVQSLIDEDFLELSQHATNRRCKIVRLTTTGKEMLTQFERKAHSLISGWIEPGL